MESDLLTLICGIVIGSVGMLCYLEYFVIRPKDKALNELTEGWAHTLVENMKNRLKVRSYEETVGIKSPIQPGV